MVKNKFYAVKKGNKTGIFSSWEECQEAIKGFPNADFKGFLTLEESQAYLDDVDIFYNKEIMPRLQLGRFVAFIDGSYEESKKTYGSGIYIITPDNKEIKLSKKGNNPLLIDQRNVVGEIIAAHSAIDWALSNGADKLTLFYDYEGIEHWADGSWKTKNPLTARYKETIDEIKDIINLEFYKVKGHSNNKYNDIVDSLAKGAIENKIFNNYGANGYVVCNISEKDIDSLMQILENDYKGLSYEKSSNNKIAWKLFLEDSNLNISLFSNSKLVVQGKLTNLFQIFTSYLIENVDCGDFTQILKDAYRISINKNSLGEKFSTFLPNVNITIPKNLETILKQAIIDLENYASSDIEFSKYTFNAFRALDGVLKLNLSKYNIPLSKSYFYDMFERDSSGAKFILKSKWVPNVDTNQKDGLEECYNYFYNNRHTLSHFGIIISDDIDTTRLINTKQDANKIIKEVFSLVNKYL